MPFPIGGPLERIVSKSSRFRLRDMRSKRTGVTSLTFQGHMTSSVTYVTI